MDGSKEQSTKVRTGAQWLLQALEAEGCDLMFGYPGGAIMPVYDALVDSPIRHILVRHEQGAALAADGYARASGKVGVCLATSGPGATNLLTGIANAYLDSIPMVAITGQVQTLVMGTDAFQEVDVFGMSLPVVKHSYVVRRAEDVYATVREAFAIARSGRPGPVLIDLPKDVAVASAPARAPHYRTCAPNADEPEALMRARALLAQAQRPLLYVGGGVGMADAEWALRSLMRSTGLPAVYTLKGLGAVDPDAPFNLGMLGMHGNPAANHAVQECDLLIVAGARFDDRATGKLATFAPNAKVLHLDIDAAEIGKLRRADVGLGGKLAEQLPALAQPLHITAWQQHCRAMKTQHAERYDAPGDGVFAPALLRQLSEAGGGRLIVASDVGQHQMWVAQHWRVNRSAAHLSSGGLGTMGFGLPAAIGAQLAKPDARVICVSGDGSIMMNIQELATLKRYGIPVKIVLLDNSSLGMVRQWQELFFAERYSEVDLSDNPDFAELARAFGIPAFTVERRDQVADAIARLLGDEGPLLCHVKIDPRANVWPLVPPGKSNAEMMGCAA
ncbi:MAG TPA: acetolactate synthase 2 catalytic subunit [Arenimonas sp.]|uniref:acetolactate synthase 2 catalytic subunit n=1 Tax=Arenimonas sp. TaxID=1872635 RepID=UPI002CC68FDF|nr:acetolactate synthase 2 catalytic subunit [Arenimonas sp.]HMB56570.1 acetolactate synthase 2 catalytic subunit [Arenimonas sp.]